MKTTTSTLTLNLDLHERQGVAALTPATEILFGGAAGGGKSHLLRVVAIRACMEIPGLNAYLFRRLYPDLMKNHMQGPGSFHELLAPLVNAKRCRIVEKEIRFWNGSKILLSHLQHEKNVFNFQGQEIHLLLFDELTHFSESMYRYLRTRCRLGGLKLPDRYRGLFPRIISGSNPGGIGHAWVKRTFVVNGTEAIFKCPKKEGGMLRQFIPSMLTDNPTMSVNDPEYESRLMGAGDATIVRALLDGDWSIVAGAVFGDKWRHGRHTIPKFPIPDWWPLWRGADDGYAAPAAVYWLTQDPHLKTFYIIDELYRRGMRPETMARIILEKDKSIEVINHAGHVYRNQNALTGLMDSGAFADVGTQEGIPRGNSMNKLGCRFKPAEKWPGSRVHRVQNFHRMMAPNKRHPVFKADGTVDYYQAGIRFFREKCPYAIDTIPTLPRDKDDPEDVDTDAEDHPFDGVTYGLQYKTVRAGSKRVTGL